MSRRSVERSDAANAEYAKLLERDRDLTTRIEAVRDEILAAGVHDWRLVRALRGLETTRTELDEYLKRCEALIKYDFVSSKPRDD